MIYLVFSRNTPGPGFYRVDYKTSISAEGHIRSERAPFVQLMSSVLDELGRRRSPVSPLFENDIPESEKGLISRALELYNQATKPDFPGR